MSAEQPPGPEALVLTAPSVAIVIPCFRQARFLACAIDSALAQSAPAREVVVVDDGGGEDLAAIVARYPEVRLIARDNQGLASARNAGLRATSSDKIVFLDADDRLLPNALAAGLDCFARNPRSAFVYGRYLDVRGDDRAVRGHSAATHADLVRFNWVGMIATVMFDRRRLLAQGGFDVSLGMCEDWDALLRLSRDHPFAAHSELVACYIRHEANMSNDVARLRFWIDAVRHKELARGLDADSRAAWREGEALWDAAYPRRSMLHLLKRGQRKARRLWSRALQR